MAFDQGNFDIFQELIEEINDLDGAIQSLATELATEIRENAPVAAVNGGSLKRSVKVLLDKYGFQIEMNDYGFFQTMV